MPPAATVGSQTRHGTGRPLGPGPGSPNVLINGKHAWRVRIDCHTCPFSDGPKPHGIGIVKDGSNRVFINNFAAARMGDKVIEVGTPTENSITSGEDTVLIG